MADGIAETVFNGGIVTPEYLQEAAFRCSVMKDIEELEAHDINDFYDTKTPTEEEKKDGE